MSGNFFLDWALLALSLFNIIIMLWLGLMIFFSAENRTWGVYLAAGGLLAGAIFFVSHTALIGQDISLFTSGVNFFWHLGWAPVVAAPFAWYIVMLWFAGYLSFPPSNVGKRHLPWLAVSILYAMLIMGLLLFANPLGDLNNQMTLEYESTSRGMGGIPVLFVAYPVFILLCVGLSMDALLHPTASNRMMGKSAREKARPWLVGAGFLLMVSAGIVAFTIGWVVQNLQVSNTLPELYGNIAPTLAWLDLVLSLLITATAVMVGQAVVTYEIFTGKPLPRQGFRRQWLTVMIFAALVSIIISLLFQLELKPVYLIIFSSFLAGALYVVFSLQSFRDREKAIHQIHPFVGSENLTQAILASDLTAMDHDIQEWFRSLVQNVLGLDQAVLMVTNSVLLDEPYQVAFPPEKQIPNGIMFQTTLELKGITSLLQDTEGLDGFEWQIALNSPRGLDGVLYLGAKSGGGFLTQEELDLSRSAGERLVDLIITTRLARQLVQMQRKRVTEQILLEQRPRRIIHDEVLPQIHALMLRMDTHHVNALEEEKLHLSRIHKMLSTLLREMPGFHAGQLQKDGLIFSLQEMVSSEFRYSFAHVDWSIDEAVKTEESKLQPSEREVVFFAIREAVRNAAKYARDMDGGLASIKISMYVAGEIQITIEDNGHGLPLSDDYMAEGNGQGLSMHSLMIALIGGKMWVEKGEISNTRVVINIPLSTVSSTNGKVD